MRRSDPTMHVTPSDEEIVTVIARHLSEHLDPPAAAPITAETRLIDDLALDSLFTLEMVAALEDHYHLNLRIETLQDVKTVGDVARVVARAFAADRMDGQR